jgi:hypothetical protein
MLIIALSQKDREKYIALPIVLQIIDMIIHLNLSEYASDINSNFYTNISYYLVLIPWLIFNLSSVITLVMMI